MLDDLIDNYHYPRGCALERINEGVIKKLYYTSGIFTIERHILGKCICDDCETLIQAAAPALFFVRAHPDRVST